MYHLEWVCVAAVWTVLVPASAAAQRGVMFHNPQRSPDMHWFMFDSNRGGRQEIYIIRADGSGLRALTDTPDESENGAEWEDDGRAISYTVGLAGHGQRYLQRLSSDMKPIGPREEIDDRTFTSTSPDGRMVLFLQRPAGSKQQIFLRSGTDILQLTDGPYSEQPSFSPDGQWVVYETRPDDPPYEYVMLMRPDGSDRRTLSVGSDPSWSPDGERVLFKWDPDGQGHQIVSMRTDGSDRIVYGRGAHPEWAADGSEISWMTDTSEGGTEIMRASASGGESTCVTCSIH